MKLIGNTILITGGSSGIGRELARQFNALGNIVIITGRRMDALKETIEGRDNMHAIEFDLNDADTAYRTAAQLIETFPSLNILLNNAGVMVPENLSTDPIDINAMELTLSTNLIGPIRFTYALLPHLRQQSNATIINVSSGLAFTPLFATPTYNATKAAIHAWTMSLRGALVTDNIEVLEIIPPGVQSDLMPGHAADPAMMPMDEFINETMANFSKTPTPLENCVNRVLFLRNAEKENRMDTAIHALNANHR